MCNYLLSGIFCVMALGTFGLAASEEKPNVIWYGPEGVGYEGAAARTARAGARLRAKRRCEEQGKELHCTPDGCSCIEMGSVESSEPS